MRPRPFGQPRGQIAAFMVVLLAIAMLMVLFIANIGHVAVTKTATANAADAAALQVVSSVGQIARQYGLSLGKGNKYRKSKCKFDFFNLFKIIIIVIMIIVTWGAATPGATGLFGMTAAQTAFVAGTTAVASALALGIQEGIINQQIARKFNKQFNKLPNIVDQIREAGILTAFLRMVDEPNRIPDTRDIDEDNDRTEKITPFSDWYDRRLAGLVGDAQGQLPGALTKMTDFKSQIKKLRDAMETLRDMLTDPGFDAFQWTEDQGCPITFWMPGTQDSSPLEPDDCALCPPAPEETDVEQEFCASCGPPPTSAQDQVDWLIVQLNDFINWADALLAIPDDKLILMAPQLEEDAAFWMGQVAIWRGLIAPWVPELNGDKVACPVPCA